MSKKQSGAIVLGAELAAAAMAEQQRLAKAQVAKSPMPDLQYDFPCWDVSLIRPVRHPLDDKLASLCKKFAKSNAPKREAMRVAISMEEFYTLLEFSKRAALFAIREQKANWISLGLTAVTMIEAERVDCRDMLVALGVLDHAARRVGL